MTALQAAVQALYTNNPKPFFQAAEELAAADVAKSKRDALDVDGTPDEINETIMKQNKRDAFVNAHGVEVSDNDLPDFMNEYAPQREAKAAAAVNPSDPHKLSDAMKAFAFMLAGNAYLTVRSLKTGTRYTFRVAYAKQHQGFCTWCKHDPCTCSKPHFVSFLSGSSNESDYTYLGIITKGTFKATKASMHLANSTVFKAFAYVFAHLQRLQMPPQTEIWHEGRCGRCGRKLTVPESIEAGIGPECASRME